MSSSTAPTTPITSYVKRIASIRRSVSVRFGGDANDSAKYLRNMRHHDPPCPHGRIVKEGYENALVKFPGEAQVKILAQSDQYALVEAESLRGVSDTAIVPLNVVELC